MLMGPGLPKSPALLLYPLRFHPLLHPSCFHPPFHVHLHLHLPTSLSSEAYPPSLYSPLLTFPAMTFVFLADPSVNDFRFMADSFLADPCNDFLFLVDPSFSSADPCTDFRFLVDALLGVFCDDLRANCLLLALPLPFLDEISLGEHAGDKRGGGLTSAEEASLGVE
mmetsp:Transcript_7626/g.12162  ORF Transcript_7626/g.12162 Transcript_7626/m.12162 type:complete len:167 (+) Transcript_7626:829-1329(+)